MTSASTNTVIGLFPSQQAADRAVDDLISHGFSRSDISVVASESALSSREITPNITTLPQTGANVETGRDAAIGGIAGFLLGLAALAIPGVGPIIAAGPLAAGLTGAAAGAATGGLVGALGRHGVPEERAHEYSDAIRSGRLMVTVHTTPDRVDNAADILDRHGATTVDEPAERVSQPVTTSGKLSEKAVKFDESQSVRARQKGRERRVDVYPGITGGGEITS